MSTTPNPDLFDLENTFTFFIFLKPFPVEVKGLHFNHALTVNLYNCPHLNTLVLIQHSNYLFFYRQNYLLLFRRVILRLFCSHIPHRRNSVQTSKHSEKLLLFSFITFIIPEIYPIIHHIFYMEVNGETLRT